MATPGLSAYQSAKWAVGGFSEVLAQEVAPLGIKVTVLEPGGMRTDWAGLVDDDPAVSEPYRQTVGALAADACGERHPAAGDPAKVAQVLLTVADLDEPPLRLLLGQRRRTLRRRRRRARAESDARWRDLSVSTDHDTATEAHRRPLG